MPYVIWEKYNSLIIIQLKNNNYLELLDNFILDYYKLMIFQ